MFVGQRKRGKSKLFSLEIGADISFCLLKQDVLCGAVETFLRLLLWLILLILMVDAVLRCEAPI